jgi:hypothetical protein
VGIEESIRLTQTLPGREGLIKVSPTGGDLEGANYIKKWVPEYADLSKYLKPIVDHAFARDRCLKAFKAALGK